METNAVPQTGSLHARIIRACPAHAECALECPQRTVEDLGQIASFDNRPLIQKVKEAVGQWRHSSQT